MNESLLSNHKRYTYILSLLVDKFILCLQKDWRLGDLGPESAFTHMQKWTTPNVEGYRKEKVPSIEIPQTANCIPILIDNFKCIRSLKQKI